MWMVGLIDFDVRVDGDGRVLLSYANIREGEVRAGY